MIFRPIFQAIRRQSPSHKAKKFSKCVIVLVLSPVEYDQRKIPRTTI